MKIEPNKEIFFEKLKSKHNEECIPEESFSEVLEKEMKEPVTNSSLVYIEKKRPHSTSDILDIMIDL